MAVGVSDVGSGYWAVGGQLFFCFFHGTGKAAFPYFLVPFGSRLRMGGWLRSTEYGSNTLHSTYYILYYTTVQYSRIE